MQFLRTSGLIFLCSAVLLGITVHNTYAFHTEYKKSEIVFGEYFIKAKEYLTHIKNLIDQHIVIPFNRGEQVSVTVTQFLNDDTKRALSAVNNSLKLGYYQRVAALDSALAADDKKDVIKAYYAFEAQYKACLENLDQRLHYLSELPKQAVDITQLSFEKFNTLIQPKEVAAHKAKIAAENNKLKKLSKKRKKTTTEEDDDDTDVEAEDRASFISLIEQHGMSGGLQWVKKHPVKAMIYTVIAAGTIYGICANLFGWPPFKQASNDQPDGNKSA